MVLAKAEKRGVAAKQRAPVADVEWNTGDSSSSDENSYEGDMGQEALLLLSGKWEDTKGSTYDLTLEDDGEMSVTTTRPSGARIYTAGLIRLDQAGRVVWGKKGARFPYFLDKPLSRLSTSLQWESLSGGGSFSWTWLGNGREADQSPAEEDHYEDGVGQEALIWLSGRWEDTKGSTYDLTLQDDGEVSVTATRPSGHCIHTAGLIRVDEAGRVVWGKKGTRVSYFLDEPYESSLLWKSSKGGKPYSWKWVGYGSEDFEGTVAVWGATKAKSRAERRAKRRQRRAKRSANVELTWTTEEYICREERSENERLKEDSIICQSSYRKERKIRLTASSSSGTTMDDAAWAGEAQSLTYLKRERYAKGRKAQWTTSSSSGTDDSEQQCIVSGKVPNGAMESDFRPIGPKSGPGDKKDKSKAEAAYLVELEQRAHAFLATHAWAAQTFFSPGQSPMAGAGPSPLNFNPYFGQYPMPYENWQ